MIRRDTTSKITYQRSAREEDRVRQPAESNDEEEAHGTEVQRQSRPRTEDLERNQKQEGDVSSEGDGKKRRKTVMPTACDPCAKAKRKVLPSALFSLMRVVYQNKRISIRGSPTVYSLCRTGNRVHSGARHESPKVVVNDQSRRCHYRKRKARTISSRGP